MSESAHHVLKSLPRAFVWLSGLALLVCVAGYIRIHGVAGFAYSEDESMHIHIASGATLAQVLQYARYETHPPLFYILLHYWMQLSDDPAFLRSLSLLLGLGTVVVYFFIGKRLNSPVTGMRCAALIAFSLGASIISYVVRQYALLSFLLSLTFYCYLRWREARNWGPLFGYILFGLLACLTHFTGLMALFCLFTGECFCMLSARVPFAIWRRWIAAHCVIVAPPLILAFFMAAGAEGRAALLLPGETFLSWDLRILTTLYFPTAFVSYVLPCSACLLPFFYFFSIVGLWPGSVVRQNATLSYLLKLCVFAFLFGMLLFYTNIYSLVMGRHSIWLLPFLLPPFGWMLADICTRLALRLERYANAPWLMLVMIGIFAGGFALYSPEERFRDKSEYDMTPEQRHDVLQFFATLGPTDLLVMARDDAVLFTNTYGVLGTDAFTNKTMATVIPYAHTHILFNPYYRRFSKETELIPTLQEAQSRGMLSGITRLVFFHSYWEHAVIADLILCDTLPKHVVTFPAARRCLPPSRELKRKWPSLSPYQNTPS